MTVAALSSLGEAALDGAREGLRVLALGDLSKKPRAESGGVNDSTTDEQTIRDWWSRSPDANVAIATGRYGDRWLVGIDLDGDEGFHSLASLATVAGIGREEVRRALATRRVRTPRGGAHLYYWSGAEIRNSQRKIAPGIDVRGVGGYLVAPPSRLPDGEYLWSGTKEIAELPKWLLDALLTANVPAPIRRDLAAVLPPVGRADGVLSKEELIAFDRDEACLRSLVGVCNGCYGASLSLDGPFAALHRPSNDLSAEFWKDEGGFWVYRDRSPRALFPKLALPQLFAAVVAGKFDRDRPPKGGALVEWRYRLLVETGYRTTRPVELPPTPDLSELEREVLEGFAYLLAVKQNLNDPQSFTARNAAEWIGKGAAWRRVSTALHSLTKKGYLRVAEQRSTPFKKPNGEPILTPFYVLPAGWA
ncbi:MAG: bifunctional DNA primase/polymerase [Thermoleophilia bacterium]|nr:bifunctional DNA primase/polymerase [Thermoleophilia bacterium]